MRRLVIGTLLVLWAAGVRAADPPAPVALGDEETVVFYGDSITEQNLYSAYLETFLDAECALHLSMGSDDGLAVFLDGSRVFANDVMRGLRPGTDELLVELTKGRHELLFKVTQGGGDFGLAVEAQVYGQGHVRSTALGQ